MTRTHATRRKFSYGMAAGAAFSIVPRHVLGGAGHIAPSGKTTVACIGLGGQGHVNMFNFLQIPEVQVVSVCDVNREGGGYLSNNWEDKRKPRQAGREPARRFVDKHYTEQKDVAKYQGCSAYVDYRELLEKEDVDAVMVATPDHSHAVITMAALKRGKHVYCEKPLTYSVEEARRVTEAARKAKVATQLGNHKQATEEARITQEYIMDGAIGDVREVYINRNALFWKPPIWGSRPPETPPVPAGLDWDRWLGPAPERPYHPAYHPWYWRDWKDFGTGPLGDMGCHILSTVFKALKLHHPVSAEATCIEMGPDVHPRQFKVEYEFPAREGMPPVKVIWCDEGFDPPRPKDLEPKRRMMSPVYIGDKGTLMNYVLIPESRRKTYGKPPQVLPRSTGQYQEWIDACRGGPPAGSDFVHHSGILTETPLLGIAAMRAGKKIEWDGPNMKITNDEAANQYLRREYRKGWKL